MRGRRWGLPMWTIENRARYDRSKLRYPSDLTDEEWSHVGAVHPAGQARRQQARRQQAHGEVDPMRGTTAGGFVIGFGTVTDLSQNQATRACCCCGSVGNASALSKRSVRSTALAPSAPPVPARQTTIGACPPSA